jgi:hypothetical protein
MFLFFASESDQEFFFARPSNVANEPRAAVTGSHKTVGRVGSICVLDGPSKEPALDETLARATASEPPVKRRVVTPTVTKPKP